MSETTDFLAELAEVLSAQVAEGSPVTLVDVDKRSEGNSWETYLVTASWDGGDRTASFAVKREPVSGIVGSYDVAREVALLRATEGLGLPVPGVAAHRAGEPGNRGFFVMERLAGVVPMPHNVTKMIANADDRSALGRRVAREMATLHAAEPTSLNLTELEPAPAPADTGRAENDQWRQTYDDVASIRIPILDLALAWLDHRADRVSGRVSLVHNDFRVGNLVVNPGDGALVGVLDWETAHFSDPVADLAWFFQRTSRGRSPLACKLLSLDDFLDEYADAAGWRPSQESLTWWAVQSLTKSAIGCLQAVAIFERGDRPELRYANMAHSVYYSLGWLNQMLRDGEWGL
ncbi:phosphotransferase family protein [Mycolicibacterium diernhoferi]|uniref:Phosphotransferase family protein n=3 Tax=Mycolicibacterium diernhoferi TaxID=1801 RepID=A0A1Q4HC67_9MYCO|nr:phosphotransferase family protein [Mycolicibacterium diernhoferi]OJZ65118.1 acyl-CoA dehydrogenase [Mycolicibacterium diernhoferi]PEG55046.1 phosphotransferase family protein [Mycolicibacterium diernhoferi]QYL23671.1 phosphotransferase family protein [Mycolicibacterium diernhoferi]